MSNMSTRAPFLCRNINFLYESNGFVSNQALKALYDL